MARFKLSPNSEFETLTQSELATVLEEKLSGFSRKADIIQEFASWELDANGNSGIPGAANNPNPVSIYTVKAGYSFALHRLEVTADGYTYGSPFTGSAGSYLEVLRAGRFVAAANLENGLPLYWEWGSDAPIFRNNEKIDVLIYGGPHSTAITFDFQGTLEALPGVLTFT